jgi:hypothetical protein
MDLVRETLRYLHGFPTRFRPPATTLNLIKKEISLLNQEHHDIILQICNEHKLIGRRHPGAVWVKSVKASNSTRPVVVFNFPDDEDLAFGTVAKEFVPANWSGRVARVFFGVLSSRLFENILRPSSYQK